jgi:hypothetical protein
VTWGTSRWDQSEWQAGPPPSQDWGADWRWWYQVGAGGIIELNGLIVEARWTSDGHSFGDGSYRGDIQPGSCTIRLWDPAHQLDLLDRYGCVFALYKPTGACWVYFYESLTRGLFASGDPADADTVFTGSPWPARLTNTRADSTFPAESASARVARLVALLNDTNLKLPAVTGSIATQNQPVAPTTAGTYGDTPALLAMIRDAATDGVAWWSPAGAAAGPGTLALNYARWETTDQRLLDRSQVIAGPPSTSAIDFYTSMVIWNATKGDTGATSGFKYSGGGLYTLPAWQGPTVRLYGDLTAPSGAEYQPTIDTSAALLADRSDPAEGILSTVSVQSGRRTTKTGGPSATDWDPYAHHFSPVSVVSLVDNTGTTKKYRVQKSDHRLVSTVWQTTHTLEKFSAPTPLP